MRVMLSDGTTALVRTSRGQRPTAQDIEKIERFRNELLQLCPKCKCYKHRCRCRLVE